MLYELATDPYVYIIYQINKKISWNKKNPDVA